MTIIIKNLQRKIGINRKRLQTLLEQLGKLLGLEGKELSILLVNDRKSRELNRTYRGIDRPTDVLSFPMYDSAVEFPEGQEVLIGDIVINLHMAARRAEEERINLCDELSFLLIHGLLHLLGYDHERNPYQARKMRKKEQELINALTEMV